MQFGAALHESARGTERTCRPYWAMSVVGAKAENICSQRAFRLLTQTGHIERRRHSDSVNCGLAPSRTRHSNLVGNLTPGLAGNPEFALARRINKLNWRLLGQTDIDEITRIVDLELKRLSC